MGRWMLGDLPGFSDGPDSQNDWMDIYGYLWIFTPYRTMRRVDVCWSLIYFDTFRWFGIPKFPTLSSLSIDGGRKECPMVANAFWWWLPCLSPRIPAEGFQRLKACVASEGVLVEVFCTLVETWTLGALPSSWSSCKLPKNPSNCSVLSVPCASGHPP